MFLLAFAGLFYIHNDHLSTAPCTLAGSDMIVVEWWVVHVHIQECILDKGVCIQVYTTAVQCTCIYESN